MIVSIHQPCYIPYLGVFYKIWKSDVFVYLDDAQYIRQYVYDRNKIKTSQGPVSIKIPCEKHFGMLLTETKPQNASNWQEKHLKTLYYNYHKCRYFKDFYGEYERIVSTGYNSLAELDMALMDLIIQKAGLCSDVRKSSEMGITTKSEERIIDIVKAVGADEYLSGTGAVDYQNEEDFTKAGIKLTYSNWRNIPYQQMYGGFTPNMSVVDYIFNEGYDLGKIFEKIGE